VIVSEDKHHILLFNVNAASGRSLRLGHNDAEDTVLQTGLDVVVIDATREAEGAVEFAD